MERVIIHVDMDYFYAAIEERENPSLRGKAVVVCMYSGRGETSGSVSTCNYIARKDGIHSGMPCSRAKAIKPDSIFLPVRKEFYSSVSDSVMEILRGYADSSELFEQISIDEAFIDITRTSLNDFEQALIIGMQMKAEIREQAGLTCSVGIGPNKLIAKMASSVRKPDGITVIKPDEVGNFLKPLKLTKLWGIGKVTEERLQKMGISTIEQLAVHDAVDLITVFGKSKGTWLKKAALGIDDSPVKERGGSDQIGRMATLPQNTRDTDMIFLEMDRLVDDVIGKVNTRKVSYRSVTITFITTDFRTHTKSRTLNHPATDSSVLRQIAREMITGFLKEDTHNLRRIGIRAANLQKSEGQTSLLEFVD
ncbi:MAG: DNA polymerase IV [Methanosarcinaceae archaeon]|nr:DNA polymerase IV [Methanosarcinaceae archaeon]